MFWLVINLLQKTYCLNRVPSKNENMKQFKANSNIDYITENEFQFSSNQ